MTKASIEPDLPIGHVRVPFAKPEKFEGQEYKSVDLDLESLTGRDMSVIKSQWATSGKFSPVPAADLDFCIMVAAKASKKPIEFFETLTARSWMKVAQEVSNFLLQSD